MLPSVTTAAFPRVSAVNQRTADPVCVGFVSLDLQVQIVSAVSPSPLIDVTFDTVVMPHVTPQLLANSL